MAFDRLLLDPTPADLAAVLRDGVKAAAAGSKKPVLGPTDTDLSELVEQVESADGEFHHREKKGVRLDGAWWTDPAGRKHVRVLADLVRHDDADYDGDEDEDDDAEEPPAVCRVYPGSVVRVSKDDGEPVTLAVCGCGAVGTPEAIAWTGETCGPCADAKQDGKPVPVPLVQRGVGGSTMKPTADGRGLVGTNDANRLVYLDLATGERVVSDHVLGNTLNGIALGPDGGSCFAGYWSNHLVHWNWRTNTLTRHGDPLVFSQFHVSPDGKHAVTGESSTLLRIDWDAKKDPLKTVTTGTNVRHGGFSRDGSKWVCLTEDQEFIEFDLTRQRRRVLREEVFEGVESDVDPEDFYEMMNVEVLDPDSGWVIVALHDVEHGTFGPARLGHVSLPSEWRELPYDDGGMSENNMPRVYGFTPNGWYALYRDEVGRVVFFPTEEEGAATYRVEFPGSGRPFERGPSGLTFSADGKTLFAGLPAGRVTVLAAVPWEQVLAAAETVE